MDRIKDFMKYNWTYFAGAVIGGLGGYIYWLYIGCETGTCPITASPTRTTLYGALMGALLFSMFTKRKIKKEEE